MQLGQRQELRQSQSLVMTPQLQQAIKLLQLSHLELAEYVDQELEKNPLLELADADGVERGDGEADQPEAAATGDAALKDSATLSQDESLPGSNDEPLDVNYSDVYDESGPSDVPAASPAPAGGALGATGPRTNGSGGSDSGGSILEQTVSGEITLREHLSSQLSMDVTDPVDRLIGFHLIHMVDEAGYLSGDLVHVAEQVGCDAARVEATLARLQNFDPPGIFARDLSECLALQLRELDRLDPAMQTLLDNLDLVARHDQAALLAKCDVDEEDLADMVHEIRALDPKPAQAFTHEVTQTVVPDVFVRPGPNGGWSIELNSDTLPRVLVNQQYYAEVTKQTSSRSDKIYIAEQLSTANWLVKSLEQRATTILKVATELVRQQDGFLANGIRHLRPLTLRNIAQAIDMHESTVSRVTANKYMSTPRGIYQMKYFFTSAISSSSGGESLSAESVRHRIRELIDAEEVTAVLSDDKIVELLRQENIDIARRTVAKYREAMRIPSSVNRRRLKKSTAWNCR